MDLKEKKLWLEIYEIAEKIENLEPWKYLWDIDLMMYFSKNDSEPFYFSVMGRGGVHKAIAVYHGAQIDGFYKLANNKYSSSMLINYQECLTCNFTKRDGVLPTNLKLIKELGLKFRGTWISFEAFEKGYEPSRINIEQIRILKDTLQNFCMMFENYISQGVKINFEMGETFIRQYDKQKKIYIDFVNPIITPEIEYNKISVNEQYEKDIMKLPQRELELEYDFLNYLPIRLKENIEKDGRLYYPRARFLAEHRSGMMLSNDILDKNKYESEFDYVCESMDCLLSYIFKFGRPQKIYVRDEESYAYLKELAERADIKLVIRPKLRTIDKFYEHLMRFM